MSGNIQATYFDGVELSTKQKSFMLFMIVGTLLDQIDLYNFATLAPALMTIWGLSVAQVGYIHGAYAVGAIVGALFFGWFSDKMGRKIGMSVALCTAGIASLLAALAPNLYFLIAVRIISGIGLVGSLMIEPAYLVEMVPSDKRSKYQGIIFTISILGIPLSVILAKAFLAIDLHYWRYVAAIPSIAFLIGILFYLKAPESPRWLINRGRIEEGKEVFKRITKKDLMIDPASEPKVESGSYLDAVKIMFSKSYIKRTILFFWLFVILQNAGYMFMQMLTAMLTKEGMSVTQATTFQQIASFAMLVSPIYIAVVGDKGGRKIPFAMAVLVVGAGLVGISMAGAANTQMLTVSVIVAGSLYVSNQLFNQLYCSECFPTGARVMVSSILGMLQKVMQFTAVGVIAAKLYATVGFSSYFKILSCIYGVSVVMILWLGVRTSGKSLEELNR